MTRLRGTRGAERVARLGMKPDDADAIVAGAIALARERLGVVCEVVEASRASRARPDARGRHVAGVVTLFPAAFADPLTLAWTSLHELAHAAGLDEDGADAFAAGVLA